ncbi:MAG TPA: aminopeptidase P family protein [Thermoplasmataceae archaeon]|nr:aminopeptidase P family protein [Thermoplasmataceae archaeon]
MYRFNFRARIENYRKIMEDRGISISLFAPGSDMFYLSGIRIDTFERLTLLAVERDSLSLIVPRLEVQRVEDQVRFDGNLLDWTDGEDPYRIAHSLFSGKGRIAVSGNIQTRHLLRILRDQSLSGIGISDDLLSILRRKKDPEELKSIERATEISEKALELTLADLREGMTEQEAARRMSDHFMELGSDNAAFGTIVSFGKNSASPHHEPSADPLIKGNVALFDFGARFSGYSSDTTRTFFYGSVNQKLKEIYNVVREAQETAIEKALEGTPYSEVDAVARNVITKAGYGKYFFHRTGHGLGIDVHEPPYVVSGNLERIENGHVFTIEPGIYLPDTGGIRIEDTVYVRNGRCVPFNKYKKEMIVL